MRALVAVDPHEDPGSLLAHAVAWGHRLGARLDLVSVSPELWRGQDMLGYQEFSAFQDMWAKHLDHERRKVRGLLPRLPEALRGTASLLLGEAAPALIDATASYDLVILGTHGRRGLARLFVGSVAEQVVRSAACPALVVRVDGVPVPSEGTLRVVLPVDATDPIRAPLDFVRAHLAEGAELTALHALQTWPEMDAVALNSWAERELRALLEAAEVEAEVAVRVRHGDNPGGEITSFVGEHGAHLVVVATHGRRGWRRAAYGSVAERVVRMAPCAVLVVR